MKSKKLSGSLFGLLARNYLLFTLTLLLIAAAVFVLWSWRLSGLLRPVDWEGLLREEGLYRGEYESLAHYVGGGDGEFAVCNGDGVVVYATGSGFDPLYTDGELACLPRYGSTVSVDAFESSGEDGAPRYLLIRHRFGVEGETRALDIMALDGDYRVVFGGFEDGRTSYTAREYSFLSGGPGGSFYCVPFRSADGEEMTLLIREGLTSEADYTRRYREAWQVWLVFLPLYLAAAGLFIWWLGRKIGRPLRRLNDAVVSQSEGKTVRVGDCGGTREIRRIGESFDRFSDRLAESERERRRLDQGRQKLIADISHDLKTPITVIAGYIDAICDGKVPPEEQQRYLLAIRGKAEALTELVNAFHEYSKVEHPEFVIYPRRTDLCEFSREYLAGKYEEIDLAGFSLEIAIPERPIWCLLDELQFRRVLDNLVANALRHNRLGTVLFFDLEARGERAVLRVADNGRGIPPERAKRIFEPFTVGSDARSGKGSGLGLAITRRIVELHGGAVALTPEPPPGRSTEFVVTLPLAPPPSPPEGQAG